MNELTKLQKQELKALCLDKGAILECVNAIRAYRAACKGLIDARYSDGECDAVELTGFASRLRDIEDLEHQ